MVPAINQIEAHPYFAQREVQDFGTEHGIRTHGRSVIPKSTRPSRIAENINVFDFVPSEDDIAAIDGLDTGRRGGPEPDAVTLDAFGREIPEV